MADQDRRVVALSVAHCLERSTQAGKVEKPESSFNPIMRTAIDKLKMSMFFREMMSDPAPIRIGDFRAADDQQHISLSAAHGLRCGYEYNIKVPEANSGFYGEHAWRALELAETVVTAFLNGDS
jgi:hypothetical protein